MEGTRLPTRFGGWAQARHSGGASAFSALSHLGHFPLAKPQPIDRRELLRLIYRPLLLGGLGVVHHHLIIPPSIDIPCYNIIMRSCLYNVSPGTLWGDTLPESYAGRRQYLPFLTIEKNRKGCIDIDTVKGCTMGMRTYPDGGCYGECYAAKTATRYGMDFSTSISRRIIGTWHRSTLNILLGKYPEAWYRIGTAGDPSHDWQNTISVIHALRHIGKVPVIVTKHWQALTGGQVMRLRALSAIVQTSTSALDTDGEIEYRVAEWARLQGLGLRSVLRLVTAQFGASQWARERQERQDYLISLGQFIDTPLRASLLNQRVREGDIIMARKATSKGGGSKNVSMFDATTHLGDCHYCPEQCGVGGSEIAEASTHVEGQQATFLGGEAEFRYVPSVIGSGFEQDVSKLALEDGIAHRAARKNMQIHSAIVLLIDGEFSGFFTFQNNHAVKEFCLLQSVIRPDCFTPDLYRRMALAVVQQNTEHYPAFITTDPRSKFETPKLFESLGFQTYLNMSNFHYMVKGTFAEARMKLLAHITMTNAWSSTNKDWLRIKAEWNKQLNEKGEKYGVPNPAFASREGCWQGENGFANVVTGHSHNGNASVLDPTACEVLLRFFMPTNGRRVYNPFGGGVQFGFIAGAYGYEYLASEIRQNQCDANNKLCQDFKNVSWAQADSATYEPEGMFDLAFCCPPYYRVEKYVDYDGQPPEGEINHLATYEQFRDALFAGYVRTIDHLNNDCFFIVMTGDSREPKGGYRCSEAETELFLKDQGLAIYNRIVYLEPEFTRLAHAKKTLNQRKFPKREQKIITAFKGKIANIKERYPAVGRL